MAEIAEKDLRFLYVAMGRVYVSVSLYICCGSGYGMRCVLRVSCCFVVMCEGSMNGS